MKKIALLLFLGMLAFNFEVAAQGTTQTSNITTPTIALDPIAAKEYLGKYKVKEAPIEELIISLQEGKLFGEAVGQGSAELKPTAEIDIFEVIGYDGTVEFVRNDLKAVIKIKLTLQGSTMEGEKQL